MTLDDFFDRYPDASFLETDGSKTRYSNGEGEGSDNESVWFCNTCEHSVDCIDDECSHCDED